MTSHEILLALGGYKVVSEITGANTRAIEQWKRIGIPAKYWDLIVAAAAERDVAGVTFATLRADKSAKQPSPQAAA